MTQSSQYGHSSLACHSPPPGGTWLAIATGAKIIVFSTGEDFESSSTLEKDIPEAIQLYSWFDVPSVPRRVDVALVTVGDSDKILDLVPGSLDIVALLRLPASILINCCSA